MKMIDSLSKIKVRKGILLRTVNFILL